MSGRIPGVVSRARYAAVMATRGEETAAPVIHWSVDHESGSVCLRLGMGTAEFEVWLEADDAAELAGALLKESLAAGQKP